jgi:hypothetical protein
VAWAGGAVSGDETELIGLLHRADWTRLTLSAELSDGSTVLVAPGKRYRYQTPRRLTGCADGVRPWEMPRADEPFGAGEGLLISGPEPPMPRLLCPAWLLVDSRLQVRGRVQACGREALDVLMTPRPVLRRAVAPYRVTRGPVDVLVDAELGILLRVAEPGGGGPARVTEMVSVDVSPAVDEASFAPPPGSRIAESYTEAFSGGGPAWWAVKTAAGLAAGGLGAVMKYSPLRRAQPPQADADAEASIPAEDPAPERSSDGMPAGPPAGDELLALLHAGGRDEFTATLHHWMDIGAMASQVPQGARKAGFGGVGLLMDAVTQRPGAFRTISSVRIAGPDRYQIDLFHQPRRGPKTIACDGNRCWKAYDDKVTTGPAEPLPHYLANLADPSWLLRCALADGMPVTTGGRPGYRLAVTKRPAGTSPMIYPAAVAVVDAETGVIQRLTYYIGNRAVERHELHDVTPAAGADFTVDLPVGLPVVEETPRFSRPRYR